MVHESESNLEYSRLNTSAEETVSRHSAAANDVILSTPRLTLRAPHMRDAQTLIRLADNPNVAKNLGTMPIPYTLTDAKHWINTLAIPASGKRIFAITDRYTDAFLGGCGYQAMEDGNIAIGYWLGQTYWGQGFAAEAAHALIDHAFMAEALSEIWVTCRVTNNQSRRVIEKCGFQFVKNGMASSIAMGGMVPIEYYVLTRKTWESLHMWGTH